MCIAIPMQVTQIENESVLAMRGQKVHRLDASLVKSLTQGDWILVFQESVLRKITEKEAEQIENALRSVDEAMRGALTEESLEKGFGDLIAHPGQLPEHLKTKKE